MNRHVKFRCPFEVQGDEDGRILEVQLAGNREARLYAMYEAVQELRTERFWMAVRFVLPESILVGCESLEVLERRILPYQMEYLAVDIDSQLAPHLPYYGWLPRTLARLRRRSRYMRYASRALMTALRTGGYKVPGDVVELCGSIEAMFKERIEAGETNPVFTFGSLRTREQKYWLVRIDRSAFGRYQDQTKLRDPRVNDAHFTIVKAPLYPTAFGRYSRRVEIVVTRDVDVAALPALVKTRIRLEANTVHAKHGIRINNLTHDQQPTGLWIP